MPKFAFVCVPLTVLACTPTENAPRGEEGEGEGEGEEEVSFEVTAQPLQGKINGQAWTFAHGQAGTGFDDGEVLLDLFGQPLQGEEDACSIIEGDQLIFGVPAAAGEYELSLSAGRSVTFVHGDNVNSATVSGLIRIDSVSATEVTGGLYAIFNGDEDFEVDGDFTAAFCE